MVACSCEKGGNNVWNGCGKKIRAWQNTDDDVANCAKLAFVATGKENDTNLQTLSSNGLQVVSVGMNAASVGDEFRMLLRRVTSETSFEIFEKSSHNIRARRRNNNNHHKNQGEKKENKKKHL